MPIYALGPDEPQIHPSCFVHPDAVVIGRVSIGEEATIWPGAVLRGDHSGRIEVGARTSIQDGTVLHTTEQWPTVIGPECVVGHKAHLEGCTVESRCLIGSGSITLNRAVVRTGAVVGAAALCPRTSRCPRTRRRSAFPYVCARPVSTPPGRTSRCRAMSTPATTTGVRCAGSTDEPRDS